jgi:hypothetical protein
VRIGILKIELQRAWRENDELRRRLSEAEEALARITARSTGEE